MRNPRPHEAAPRPTWAGPSPITVVCSALLLGALASAGALRAQDDPAPDADADAATGAPDDAASATSPFGAAHVAGLQWRNVGPANMGGRVTDVDVVTQRPTTWYVATAGGGLWKTTNAGTTWRPLFQDLPTVSLGDVAVAPSNPDVVWVGTGEENARNSVSWGDGVYKSTDGGATFEHMGLERTFQIGHIAIHPDDADVVFVAALGRLWGHDQSRGVFRTKDGGATWEKVLYLDEKTGCIDVRIDAHDHDVVYACMYERMRDMFDSNDPAVRFGEKAGLFKSTDGGDTWQRVDTGLPTCKWGRSGLAPCASKPGALYLIVETEKSGWATSEQQNARVQTGGNAFMGILARDADDAGAEIRTVTPGGPAADAGLVVGDVVSKVGDQEIEDWAELRRVIRAADGGSEVELQVRRDGKTLAVAFKFGERRPRGAAAGGGGGGGRRGGGGQFGGMLGGQQPNVQKQQDEGDDKAYETGGVFRSDDYGATWRRVNSLTDRPFYYSVIAADPQNDQTLYSCGVPFYASFDGGATFRPVHRGIHVDFHALWIDPQDSDHLILGCDGGLHVTFDRCETWELIDNLVIGQFYHCDVDSSDPYRIYGGLQDNGTWGGPSRTRWREGIAREDWVTIHSGDGFRAICDPDDPNTVFATSQNGGLVRVDIARAQSARVQKPRGTRYNWDTPFFVSPHNSKILYFAGDKACRSIDAGRNSEAISATLGLTDRGTATAFAESPVRAGLLYVGTDDGALWRSEDGGHTWEAIHERVLGMPGPRYVSSIEPSHYEADRVFVTFDGHRSDDFETHVYVSDDAGDTWTSLIANLPDEPVHVLREYPRGHEDLLFLGTEFSCYVSLDRGGEWFRLGEGLPTVPVRDLAIQARDTDLVAATHGRGIWVVDVEPLRQLSAEVAAKDVHLFQPERATQWTMRSRVQLGHRVYAASNPPDGATVYLWSKQAPPEDAKVTVHDVTGKQVGALVPLPQPGLQALQWPARVGEERAGGRGGGARGRGGRGGRGGGGGFRMRGTPAPPGDYSVRYALGDDDELVQLLVIRADPEGHGTPLSAPAASTTDSSRN